MKFTFPGNIARFFGYELVKLSRLPYRDINAHLLALFKLLDINCVLDVGANVGQYATALRRAGYDGYILSFEPIKECFTELIRRKDELWHVFNYALGNTEQTLDLRITHKTVFSSLLPASNYLSSSERFHKSARVTRIESVPVKRLDRIFSEIIPVSDPRVFLKLDTQGYDLEVLKGAQQSLPYIHGVQSEISSKPIYAGMPTHLESLQFIDALGYELTDIYPLSHDKCDMSLLEFDCIFRKKVSA